MNLICQHHDHTDCTIPAITNAVTIRILIRKSDPCVYTQCMSKPTEVSYFESASIPAVAFFTVRSMSYSQQLHGEPTTPPWPEPRVPTATALVQSEAGYANAATSTHQPIPAPPSSTPNPMWDSGQTAEEEDLVQWERSAYDERAELESDDEDDVEWERMEYVRCNRLPLDYLDGWSNDALKRLDDSIRDDLETCRRMNAERRLLDMGKAPPPAAPQSKGPPPGCPASWTPPSKAPPPLPPQREEPPPRCPTTARKTPGKAPPGHYSLLRPVVRYINHAAMPMGREPPPGWASAAISTPGEGHNLICDCRNGDSCIDCCEDWCPLCYLYDDCECDDHEAIAVAMDERQVRRVERHNRAAAARRELQSRGLVPEDEK